MLDNLRKLQHRCNVVNSKAGGKWKVCPESLSSEGITACIPNTPNTAQMHGLWISIYCPIGQRSDCLCWLEPILHGPPLGKFLIQSLGQEQLIVLRSLSQYFQASCEERASNTSRISQKDSRNLHYICKMWPLGSTAPKKPSKLLTCAAGRRISRTWKWMAREKALPLVPSSLSHFSPLWLKYLTNTTEWEELFWLTFQEMEAIVTARNSEGSTIYSDGNLWHGLWPQRMLD